jgi:hypothetical protein
MSRFAYEQAVLAEVASEQALTLEEFVGLPAYIGRESSYDTWYDGHIVRIEIKPPTLAEAGDVVVDILGPYWDRIFRCNFHEVFRIETVELNMIGMPEIHGIEVASAEGGRICAFRTHDKSQEFRLTFSTAEVTRLMLRTPLERELVGS